MTRRYLDEPKLRQSISFTKEQHDALSAIAEKNNVSFCWVVRYACDLLVRECPDINLLVRLPLDLRGDNRGEP
jgi:hypothetical protein